MHAHRRALGAFDEKLWLTSAGGLAAIPVAEPTRIIHSDRLRPKFYDAL
jgi:hypothetical protein